MKDRLLLALPHRQFVWTFPRILRPYFRHNRRLFYEISRLIIIERSYTKVVKRPIKTGMVVAYHFTRLNAIALENFCSLLDALVQSLQMLLELITRETVLEFPEPTTEGGYLGFYRLSVHNIPDELSHHSKVLPHHPKTSHFRHSETQ